ncbi:unnamed protein product [Lota lota]
MVGGQRTERTLDGCYRCGVPGHVVHHWPALAPLSPRVKLTCGGTNLSVIAAENVHQLPYWNLSSPSINDFIVSRCANNSTVLKLNTVTKKDS